MGHYILIFSIVIAGILLLWFGYTLAIKFSGKKKEKAGAIKRGAQICPVCSAKLASADQVETEAFPAQYGRDDRLMYIKGCLHCLAGDHKRECPVCGKSLKHDDFLVARISEKDFNRSHVHVQGCSKCCKIKQ